MLFFVSTCSPAMKNKEQNPLNLSVLEGKQRTNKHEKQKEEAKLKKKKKKKTEEER